MEAIDRAVYYLNIKPRTRKQVIDYLLKKEYPQEEIDTAVSELEKYHYIDDANYCRLYFEMGFEKRRGIGRIKRELAEKGVDKQLIDEVFEELEEVPDQLEMALEEGRLILQGTDTENLDYKEKQKLMAKVSRRLASKGFTADIAYKVARHLIEG